MPRGASHTAEAVCLFRAIETRRRPGARLLEDPFAERLLPSGWSALCRPPLAHFWDRPRIPVSPSALQTFVALRHRWIDDLLLAFLAAGGQQVVILGAGYDSRALRFEADLAGRSLVEVDFPATQARKKALLHTRIPERASPATFLGVDFARDALGVRLAACTALEPHARTFFIWEGVSMYLPPAAVDETLAVLRGFAGPGSSIVADWWHVPPTPAWGEHLHRVGAHALGWIGEPLRFALAPLAAPAFFAARGMRAVEVLDGDALGLRYEVAPRRVFPGLCVVDARF